MCKLFLVLEKELSILWYHLWRGPLQCTLQQTHTKDSLVFCDFSQSLNKHVKSFISFIYQASAILWWNLPNVCLDMQVIAMFWSVETFNIYSDDSLQASQSNKMSSYTKGTINIKLKKHKIKYIKQERNIKLIKQQDIEAPKWMGIFIYWGKTVKFVLQ